MLREGSVKWYSLAKGYGFVTPDEGGDDIFVHHSIVPDEKAHPLVEGERVRFEVTDGPRGARAVRIERIS